MNAFHRRCAMLLPALLVLVFTRTAPAEPPETAIPCTQPYIVRKPQWPLKDKRTLLTDEEIATARANVKTHPAAKAVADEIIKSADEWAAWDDADLVKLIADARVPRAFETGTAGCPKCGHEMLQKFGQYGWIIDPKKPFKVKCPVDGSVYPTNDYAAWYESDFKDKKGWDTAYVDDGWGWLDPKTGERTWFVAYYNHWMLYKHLVPGTLALSRAYLLTGDKKYAHKAVVLLHRFAEVYPAMDLTGQSRYGTMQRARGAQYPGKIVNLIWETGLFDNLVTAYDGVWETIDSDKEAQQLFRQSGREMRAFIEANLLEDGIDAYFAGKIRGNFGMHQNALADVAIVRQFGEQEKWLDHLMNESTTNHALLGLSFALYNLVYRDGIPSESAPGYNNLWVSKITDLAGPMQKAGRDVFALPKLRRMYDAVIEQIVIRCQTPNLGDSGSVWGGISGQSIDTFQSAYRHYKDPLYATFLASFGAAGDKGTFQTFESLFHPVIEAPADKIPPQKSRLMDGFGLGILNNPADSVGASVYYGLKAGHGHFDRLNFELFASGKPIMPDLGYPDAMNEYVPGIYSWSKNTISHNTVMVDRHRQTGNAPGVVQQFVDTPFARVIDVNAPGTYSQCPTYRRALIMVDVDPSSSYFIDVFNVVGGKEHDYSLHGPPGEFKMIGGSWSEPARGTLAGENVTLGQFYDDPKLAAPGYSGGFGGYTGSGFQHLTHVQRLTDGNASWVGEWAYETNKDAHVRLRVLPQDDQQVLMCQATVSPVKYPQVLRYFIARRQLPDASGDTLASRFVSVIEPYNKMPILKDVQAMPLKEGQGVALRIERADGSVDTVIYDMKQSAKLTAGGERTDASVAVITYGPQQALRRAFFAGGSFLVAGGKKWHAPAAVNGVVSSVDPRASRLRVKLDRPAGEADAEAIAQQVAHFANPLHRTAHPIESAKLTDGELDLATHDVLITGRVRVTGVEGDTLASDTAMPLAPTYIGASVFAGEPLTFRGRIAAIESQKLRLTDAPAGPIALKKGDDAWIVNVAPGDRLELEPRFSWMTEDAADGNN